MSFAAPSRPLQVTRRIQEAAQLESISGCLVDVLETIGPKMDSPEISCDDDENIFDILQLLVS